MALISFVSLSALTSWDANYRKGDLAAIQRSLEEFGFLGALRVKDGVVMAGNQTLAALRSMRSDGLGPPKNVLVKKGEWHVATIDIGHLNETQAKAFAIADNRTHDLGEDCDDLLAELLTGLAKEDSGMLEASGYDGSDILSLLSSLGDSSPAAVEPGPSLADRFLIPPFTVLDGRSGLWNERKRYWLDQGLTSHIGRSENLVYARSAQSPQVYEAKNKLEAKIGRSLTWPEFFDLAPGHEKAKGTSVFDPVLCELVYRWFCPQGGSVLDPFAGGSVRGFVADRLGLHYTGVDLREEQVEANRLTNVSEHCRWVAGDSCRIDELAHGEYDLVFSCPPYGDLEIYSDDPNDLSTMDYGKFRDALSGIVAKSLVLLKENRFAVFVVSEFRDKSGFYRNFISDTISAFTEAGANYYNEAVLVNHIQGTAIRVGKSFSTTRKLGKVHQNVLVFVKGDPRLATEVCGVVETEVPLHLEVSEETLIDGGSVAV